MYSKMGIFIIIKNNNLYTTCRNRISSVRLIKKNFFLTIQLPKFHQNKPAANLL
uniref:Uncharacterized protein n=1 Tax=Meloidogyne enterolobii TaxID=390850 RepID=A0A6V7TTP4_MELEN|nr:unnamed protein product [Meloidogyne enterolobii]